MGDEAKTKLQSRKSVSQNIFKSQRASHKELEPTGDNNAISQIHENLLLYRFSLALKSATV